MWKYIGSSNSKFLRVLTAHPDPNWITQQLRKILTLFYIIRPRSYISISLLLPWSDSCMLVTENKKTPNNVRSHAKVFLKGIPRSSWDVSKIKCRGYRSQSWIFYMICVFKNLTKFCSRVSFWIAKNFIKKRLWDKVKW